MKFLAISVILPFLLICSAAEAEEDQVVKSPPMIRISFEWVEMSSESATRLTRTPRTTSNDNDLRDKVDEMIGADKAVIYESKIVTTYSGQPCRIESIREETYSTSYYPPELPNVVNINADGTSTPDASSVRSTGPSATAFETRNTGTTVEVDPVFDADSNTVRMSITPEIVSLVGQNSFASYEDDRMASEIKSPVFYTNRLKTQLIVRPGKYLMATSMNPHDGDGQPDRSKRVILFVRADVLKNSD